MKKIIIIISIIVIGVAIGGFGISSIFFSVEPETESHSSDSTDDSSQFVEYGVAGNILKINPSKNGLGVLYIEGPKSNGATYKKAYVRVTEDAKIYGNGVSSFKDLKVGMYVNVFLEDEVAESYPIQGVAKQINIVDRDTNVNDNDEN